MDFASGLALGTFLGWLLAAWMDELERARAVKRVKDEAVQRRPVYPVHNVSVSYFTRRPMMTGSLIVTTDSGVWMNGAWYPPGRHEIPNAE